MATPDQKRLIERLIEKENKQFKTKVLVKFLFYSKNKKVETDDMVEIM
jgi:hypothetical protein